MKPVLLLCLLAVLAACSSPSPTASPTPSDAPSSSTAPPSAAADTPTSSAPAPPPRPARDGCHRLTLSQAVAPVVAGTDVPCRQKHTSETYKIGRLPLLVGGHLVAVDSPSVQSYVADTCRSTVGDHVGGSPEDLRLSMLQAVWFTPSVEEAALGADWFRCDVVALSGSGRLALLPRSTKGVLASSDRFAMCSTASPDSTTHKRVPCSARHSWTAIATVGLSGQSYPSARAASRQMDSACRSAARARAADPLDFSWSQERPSQEQWKAGQRYGICWAPAS
ncbi:hypothetical protein G7071_11770 [Nocardioides piscis]|uniref:Septum formation-related domain-containing protein n=2 Tax=Nocardioides piscis TaxID=2714938 RepID=A0A6G7YKX3_9ACTN|nr:hypothetical protein G7071_11770 [Nocardioides piscis]